MYEPRLAPRLPHLPLVSVEHIFTSGRPAARGNQDERIFQTDMLDERAGRLAIGRVEFEVFCENALPPVAVCQQFLLIVK